MRAGLIAACCLGVGMLGAASAKELPRRKAEEPKKATGCEYLGAGYVKAEGSDTCIKVGGSVRVEGGWTSGR